LEVLIVFNFQVEAALLHVFFLAEVESSSSSIPLVFENLRSSNKLAGDNTSCGTVSNQVACIAVMYPMWFLL